MYVKFNLINWNRQIIQGYVIIDTEFNNLLQKTV